jgi:hypothetical protein
MIFSTKFKEDKPPIRYDNNMLRNLQAFVCFGGALQTFENV